MSFVSNALGVGNGYQAQNISGGTFTNQPQLAANANIANQNYQAINPLQTNLAAALLAQSQGQGPNIANLQLQQATNQNNQQAAGAIASQRGMNPALAQRIISQQQAMNNQNAAGQSGILRAQQQLAAQQGLANVYGQQANEANSNLAANESAIGNQNNAAVSASNAANQANAQIAQNNANQNAGIAGGIMNSIGSLMSLSDGGIVSPEKHLERLLISTGNKIKPVHLASGGNPLSGLASGISGAPQNAIDPGLANGPSAASENLFGGFTTSPSDIMSGATSAAPSASGGSVGGSAAGGATMAGGAADAGGGLMDALPLLAASHGAQIPKYGQGGGIMSMLPMLAMLAAHGGKVPAMVSPGERFIPPEKVEAVRSGKESVKTVGKKIPGKAKVKGDSEKNDTVKTNLAPGGVVIPRTKAENDEDAREFLHAIKADKEKKNGPSGYAKILAAKRKNAS